MTWANRLLFSPDAWSNTSTQLLRSPKVRAATANYIVDQIDAHVHLPRFLLDSGLAVPASRARAISLQRAPRCRRTRCRACAAGASGPGRVGRGQPGRRQGAGHGRQRWKRWGRHQTGACHAETRGDSHRAASHLGLGPELAPRLPANTANLTVFRSDQLLFVQDIGKAIRGLALLLTIWSHSSTSWRSC